MVTIKQIAKEVGISPSTVSIVLSGKSAERHISEETQSRILDTAARLGYQPNLAARSLRGKASEDITIAMFWAQDFRASMMIRFWDGIRTEIVKTGRNIQLTIIPYDNDHLKEQESLTGLPPFHAAIVCNASYSDLEFLEDAQIPVPVVLYNRFCRGYSSVNVDDAKMGALAARAFYEKGCRTAYVMTSRPAFVGMEDRVHGFRLEGEHLGLKILPSRYCENSIKGAYEAGMHRIRHEWADEMPDALFCGSSFIAQGVRRAFYESKIPSEQMPRIIAIGNATSDIDEFSVPSTSVIQLPMERMASKCFELVLEQLAGKISEPRQIMLETEYIARESC